MCYHLTIFSPTSTARILLHADGCYSITSAACYIHIIHDTCVHSVSIRWRGGIKNCILFCLDLSCPVLYCAVAPEGRAISCHGPIPPLQGGSSLLRLLEAQTERVLPAQLLPSKQFHDLWQSLACSSMTLLLDIFKPMAGHNCHHIVIVHNSSSWAAQKICRAQQHEMSSLCGQLQQPA